VTILERLVAFPETLQHLILVFYRNEPEKPNGVAQCGIV
jgi:hypothetical protein